MRSRFNEKVEHEAKGVLPMARMLNLGGLGLEDLRRKVHFSSRNLVHI